MTTVLFSASAALATLVIVLLGLLLLRRSRPASPAENVTRVAETMNERMEAVVRELSERLEHASEEGQRGRFLVRLAGSIDLDEVLARTLEATTAMPGVDAAMVVLQQREARPLIGTRGMTNEEASHQPLALSPNGRQTQAVTVNYRYTAAEASANGDLIRGGAMVPLRNEDDSVIGTLASFWRGSEREPTSEELAMLEELAESAGPALDNARRFREARQLADLDALTGLHNRRYFHETLAREVSRGHRYGRRLALIVLDLDDFKEINDRIGHLSGDAVLAEAAERVRDVVRTADIACRIGGDEFAVILPESAQSEAEQLYERLQSAVSSRTMVKAGRLLFSAGIAELRPEDNPTTIFERADEALYHAKDAGKGQMRTADSRG